MDIVIATLIVIGSLILGIAGNMVASELYDRSPSFARWLIGRAAQRLPQHERTRHVEEWLADNNDYPGKMGKIVHAVGCFVASQRMTQLSTTNAGPVQPSVLHGNENPSVYRILVWVANDLNHATRQAAIEKEVQYCNSVLNELKVSKENRIVEIRIITASSPLVNGVGTFSNIWNASIDI